jgi:adenine deaminase
MTDLILQNCDILHVEAGRSWVDFQQDIWIAGQHITRIAPSNAEQNPPQAKVIDASGLLADSRSDQHACSCAHGTVPWIGRRCERRNLVQ